MLKTKRFFIPLVLLILCMALLVISVPLYQSSAEQNKSFSDVDSAEWFYSDVEYVKENGLMNGTSDTEFSPDATTTRGMIVTILWRLDGKKEVADNKSFSDVNKDAYYYDAVSWAFENKIVSGYSDTVFGPEDLLTREQLATFFWRYAAYKGYDVSKKADLSTYKDADKISDYAVSAIGWANKNGIITGTSHDMISPEGYAQRCQVAAILKRFCTQFISKDDDKTSGQEDKGDASGAGNENSETKIESSNGSENNTGGTSLGGGSMGDTDSGETSSGAIATNKPQLTAPTISASCAEGAPGDTVQIFIKVEDNPGILGMVLSAEYDNNSCRLESVSNGEAVSDVLDLTTSKSLESGVRFVWDGIDISESEVKNGTVLVMNFTIPSTAKEGKYPVVLKYSDGDIVDRNLNSISPEINNGYITVVKK